MKKVKTILLTIFVLILATSCERKEEDISVQEQVQIETKAETKKLTQRQQELSDEVLQNLVDVSDKEDLIASGKIKPAPEFVEIDGKMVRTSPEEYESEDGCGKARELYLWRLDNKLFRYEELRCQNYHSFPHIDVGGLCLMKSFEGLVFIDNFGYNTEFSYQIYDRVTKSKNKEIYFGYYKKLNQGKNKIVWTERGIKILENNINLSQEDYGYAWIDLKNADIKKYLFLKQKDCIATFYKGEEF